MNRFIEVRGSKIHNKGVFAKRDIPKGTSIIEYKGELIDKEEAERRGQRDRENGTVYLFTLNDRYDIDGTVGGNESRFINHSCNPNCESVNYDDEEVWVEAIRDIKKGEEITYDYCLGDDEFECRCGSENCKGKF
ncbi:MAG: SET domain-containing protein [Nanobdellota archaeon]